MIGINDQLLHMRNVLAKYGQGAFYAYNSTSESIAQTAEAAVTLDTEGVDVCSWFSGNTFTPKQPGYYLLFGKVMVGVDADFADGTTVFYTWIRKNAAAGVPADAVPTEREGVPMTVVTIVEANGTTDAFDLAVQHNSSGAVLIYRSTFGGCFISYKDP